MLLGKHWSEARTCLIEAWDSWPITALHRLALCLEMSACPGCPRSVTMPNKTFRGPNDFEPSHSSGYLSILKNQLVRM